MSQAELLVIDEAAAIPLPTVQKMLGPYLVFLCSTVNGYEGTGRSLSLKLIKQLRDQSSKSSNSRTLVEVQLDRPIRYASGDQVESWLSELLCLNCQDHVPSIPAKLPHPDHCDVFFVERQTLFSFHKSSEFFLQQMMALCVASHYKNSPNDLVLISDAPAHRLFVLLAPIDVTKNSIPEILCVIQVNLEGGISKRSVQSTLGRGASPNGDLIPWTLGQQFQDLQFPSLSGARIVRIAVHPALMRTGYGTRALTVLERYYEGGFLDPDQIQPESEKQDSLIKANSAGNQLLEEEVNPREGLPPLFTNLSDRKAEPLDYIGTSFGLTLELYNFWHKSGYLPVYIRQTKSEITGEFTIIMIKPLSKSKIKNKKWIESYVEDFRRRFISLLSGAFSEMDPALALTILNPRLNFKEEEIDLKIVKAIRSDEELFDVFDQKRLQSYANNLIDHHLILDLVSGLAKAYFAGKLPVSLSYGQAAILLSLGLQMKDVSYVEKAIDLPSNQVLALFSKTIRKFSALLKKVSNSESTNSRDLTKDEGQSQEAEIPEQVTTGWKAENLEHFKVDEKLEFEGLDPKPGAVVSVKRKSKRTSTGKKQKKSKT